MTDPTKCLKVILYSSDGSGGDFYKTFKPLTERSDIIYNEFFNYVRNGGKKVKMVLTACTTTPLDYYTSATAKNPYYVRLVFDGIRGKNEVSENRNIEFIVPTLISNDYNVKIASKISAFPALVQWINLPKSFKNLGVELESMEIFTSSFTVQILDNNSDYVIKDPLSNYDSNFMVEFWLYVDE
jgi:hypothetical protein